MRIPSSIVALVLAVGLAACSNGSGSSSEPAADDRARSTAEPNRITRPCPDELPQAISSAGEMSRVAKRKPRLPRPQRAWVCVYRAANATDPSRPAGATLRWVRRQAPVRVEHDELRTYQRELDRIEPADDGRVCRSDLGPRYVLAYADGAEVLGVIVDDFGCQDVRLTDSIEASVPGVLQSSPRLLRALKATSGHGTPLG